MKSSSIAVLGSVLSLALLVVILIFNYHDPLTMTLPTHWFLISIIPLVVSLFIGGYITKISALGVDLEATLKTSTSTLYGMTREAISPELEADKGKLGEFEQRALGERRRIRVLKFYVGGNQFYTPDAISGYFKHAPNLDFLLVISQNNTFICMLPKAYFDNESSQQNYLHDNDIGTEFNTVKINNFTKALKNNNVEDIFKEKCKLLALDGQTSLAVSLKQMRQSQINIAPVINSNGKYIGLVTSSDIERIIADSVLEIHVQKN